MSKVTAEEFAHATQIDLSIGGTSMLRLTSDGVQRPNGKDSSWFTYLTEGNIAVGGQGAAYAEETIGTGRIYKAWELPTHASNSPFVEINFWLPPDYDGSELKFTAYMFKQNTATGTDIDTRLRIACVGAGDYLDPTVSAAVDVVDTVGTNDYLFLVEHTVTPANAADGGLVHGRFQRVPSLPADDYTDSVYLIGARVEYS